MNVALIKTKAEQALTEQFETARATLPGGEAVAELRAAALGRFAAAGLPHRRIEEWKYTDLRSSIKDALQPAAPAAAVGAKDVDAALGGLAAIDATRVVFVNGRHDAALSTRQSDGLEIGSLGAALKEAPAKVASALMQTGAELDALPLVALNAAYVTDGAILRIASKARLSKPVLLVFLDAGGAARTTTRNVISIGAGAEATVVEVHAKLAGAADGQANTLTQTVVGDAANVAHLKVTRAGNSATHLATWITRLGKDSVYRAFQATSGSGLVRNETFATFDGEGAKLDISGVFLARGREHIDTTLTVDHAVPGCESRELFKGVLADRGRGIFQGKVIVRPDAQKTDGKQMAQALMLSEDAEFDSKPELEIYADDVICGHGSTSAEIDADLLFYMRARGIPTEEARALLIESFVGEALDKIEHEGLRKALMAEARSWLAS
ncbi:MAG: Fe-S cluster assembly protein SufD [Hyphomicrobiaceae bacterium]